MVKVRIQIEDPYYYQVMSEMTGVTIESEYQLIHTLKELAQMKQDVYKRQANDCVVISDEIWSDLILEGYHHTPAQSVSEDARNRTVAMYAPSKTFNLAGLVGSYHIIYNSYLRDRVMAASSKSHYNAMNVLSMYALIGAYKPEGYEWVDELCRVLSGNVSYACDFIKEHFPGVTLSRPQGTYMLFLDCEEWCKTCLLYTSVSAVF